jgi:tRNA modification GTPase
VLLGGLSDRVRAMNEETLDALAHVEATVDFPDEDLHPEGNEKIAVRFEEVARSATALAETFAKGRLLREGARVVIAGRPNVGKSSLLNALAGRDRAIVTDEPGTTRDVVEEPVDFDGLPVILADTAGIRDATSLAEKEGVKRSREAASSADLVLLVWDASEGWTDADASAHHETQGRPAIHVANKSDLPSTQPPDASLRVSARTGAGLSELKAEVRRLLLGPKAGEGEELVITRARHRQALLDAARFLEAAAAAARRRESPDLIASDARRGLDALGEITGKTTTEDLLGRIFSRFCVGK